ncbi:MAG: DUF1552 domain-containing protein [Planctomycetota bacterium]|nr:DUF1552 domain-containing protein [Planctomycetota bacterium]
MSQNWKISRRTMLRGTGVAVALPMLEVMNNTPLFSKETGTPPKRMISLFMPNGVNPATWDVKGEGADYEISESLAPLNGLRDHVSILSNLDNTGAGGHVGATSGFLSGIKMKNGVLGISMDQLIAKHLGNATRFPSIVLGTEPPRQGGAGAGLPIAYANTVSWASPNSRISPEINPQVAFDRLFRTGENAIEEAQELRSVVDLVLEDAKRLKSRASKNDGHKIEEYLSSVRGVEKQIDNTLNPPAREWVPPTTPELIRPPAGIPARRDVHVKMMIDLLILALQTDTTRVGTLMLAHGFSRCNFGFMGLKGDHHTISHHKNQDDWLTEYTAVTKYYVGQYAYLMERLQKIDEGGSNLLENSIVLFGSGLKDGNGHVRSNLPILLGGHGGGTLNPGRHIKFAPGTVLPDLHLSLIQRFGLDIDTWADRSNTLANL